MMRWCARALLMVGVLACLVATLAGSALAATQTYSGDVLQMTVDDYGRPAIFVKSSPSSGYVQQYFGGGSWGSVIWLNSGGSWAQYGTGYMGSGMVPVSNTMSTVGATTQIVTVADLGTSGVRMTQRFSHTTGDRFVTKEWTLTNIGSTTYSGVSLYHGGDSYFGGSDSARGYFDPTKTMVYVRNNDYTNWGIMGFYANPATPATHYFEGHYSTGNGYASNHTNLPDTVNASFVDAGYYLQWEHASLAPGQSWTIQAYEIWTPGGSLQMVAPGGQNASANSTVTLPFTVQNLGVSPLNLALSATSNRGWTTTIAGGNSVVVPAGTTITCNVEVVIPASVAGTNTVTLSASGDATASAATILTVVDIGISVSPDSIDFGSLAPGGSASQVVTITNNGASTLTFGTVGVIAPFGKASDGCSGTTLASGQSCTVTATFNPASSGTFSGSLNIPVVTPALVTSTVSLSGSASSNTAPTVDAGTDGTANEGTPFTRSGSFTDPGSDSWTATVDYGDGGGAQALTITGTTFNLSHTYADNGAHTVTVRVSDGSLTGTDSFSITVGNIVPTVSAGSDATIDEGQTLTRSGSFTDPGSDSWTATVDYGDGGGAQALTITGTTFNLSHTYSDNGTHAVTVRVTDDDSGVGSSTFSITVGNIVPTVSAGSDATIDEGQTLTRSGSFTDPGSDSWTATVDYGDGGGAQALTLTARTFGLSHEYGDNGSYIVTVRVTDDDGAVGSGAMTVTVSNVDPLIEVGKEGTTSIAGFGTFFFGRAGYETRMHLTTSDVGTDDLIVDLANGGTAVFRNNSNTPDPAQSSSGVRPFSVQFDSGIVYPLPGVFTAEFKVTDDDGGTGKAGAAVLVRGVESGLLDVSGWLARFQGSAAASTLVAADDGALLGYLKVASYMSRVFGSESALSNSLSLSSVAQAAGILAAGGSGNDLAAARALLLAALLNFVSGAEEWGTLVDTDGDGRTDSAYMLVLDEAERLILKPDASSADFARVCALLRACPQPEQKPSPGFTDVPDNHPYREAIEGLTSLGIISGFQDGSFRPDGDVTRQQFAKLIVKTLGLDVTGTEICPFVDVTPGGDETDSCYPDKYIAVCVTHGIILGKTLTTFAPYASITRQQLLSMVARAAMLAEPPADFDPGFAVGQFSQSEHYLNARKAAYAGLCEGLVGVGPAYDFRGVATRGECAQLLWRLLKSES